MGRNVKGRQDQLGLNVLVHVVESSDVWGSIATHKVGLLALEMGNNLFGRGFLCNVSLDLNDAWYRGL
jgi:hypothetical protein